ncbi:MAG: tyrosine-type recombinase/integrase [Bacteroidetes bacterium]|nr:tyrosine-type recombinase/integrase [Bacteroidota bacterium]
MKAYTPQTISLQKLLVYHSDYVNELQRRNPETRGTYERTLREFMRWVRLEPELECSAKEIEKYKKFLLTKRKLSPVSVTMYLSSVRKFFDYLVGRGILTTNAAKLVKGGSPGQQHSRQSITMQDVQALIQAIERRDEIGFRDFAVVKLMIGCGLSEIELIRADIGDLQTRKGAISIRLQMKGRKSKDRTVTLPNDVKDAVKSYLAFRTNAQPHEPLFMSAGNRTRGQRMTSRGIRERINYYLQKAGVKNGQDRKITALSLRLTAIKTMVQQGASVEEIKKKFHIVKELTVLKYLEKKKEQ